MQQSIDTISVFCDDFIDGHTQEHERVFIPVVPKFLFPIQSCDSYGIMPPIIPPLKKNGVNTCVLWTLIALLTRIEDIWEAVTKVRFKQSNWHGWLLTYIIKYCFTHLNNRAAKNDPFKSNSAHMMSLDTIINRMVSFIIH